jgi:hypothetical protein
VHIPDVYETVFREVNVVFLNNHQFCVIIDPVGESLKLPFFFLSFFYSTHSNLSQNNRWKTTTGTKETDSGTGALLLKTWRATE